MNKVLVKNVIIILIVSSSYCLGQWNVSISKDEMTGESTSYVSSPSIGSNKPMGFPYSDTKAWMGVGCDGKDYWVYFGFTNAPNLADTEIETGYNIIRTRIKWDENLESVKLTQKWQSKFLHFDDDKIILQKIINSKYVLLELDWYGEGKVYFKFPLEGANKALDEMRSNCKM